MTRDELLRLIAQGEGLRLEFPGRQARTAKRSLVELEDGVRTIAAFAVRPDGAVDSVLLCGLWKAFRGERPLIFYFK